MLGGKELLSEAGMELGRLFVMNLLYCKCYATAVLFPVTGWIRTHTWHLKLLSGCTQHCKAIKIRILHTCDALWTEVPVQTPATVCCSLPIHMLFEPSLQLASYYPRAAGRA